MASGFLICSLAFCSILVEIFDGFFHLLAFGGVFPGYSFLAIGLLLVASGEEFV